VARPSDEQPALAEWARTLQRRVRQRGINAFILHGPGTLCFYYMSSSRAVTAAEATIPGMLATTSVA